MAARLLLLLGLFAAVAAADGLLVVAPRSFAGALGPFLAHKRARLETRFVALEDALRADGADDPERLKRVLYEAWRKDTRYVLLVGDASLCPVRYMVLDRKTPAAFDYAFYPSDLYYADVARADGTFESWNARHEGFHARYFGEVRGEKNKDGPVNYDGVDYLPELAVGRWPVGDAETAARVAARTIAFEEGKRTGRALLVDVPGWVECKALHDRLAAALAPAAAVTRLRAPQEAAVLTALGAGTDLVLHTGHGDSDRWDRCLGAGAVARLPQATAPAVFFSAGCSTAYFAPLPPYDGYADEAGAAHGGTNHGEVFDAPPPPPAPYQEPRQGLGTRLLASHAVAYLGCNTGSQPCGLTLLEGFAEAWPRSARLGDAWVAALRRYHEKERLAELVPTESWYPPSVFFQGMKFMLFGDPSLALRE